MFRLIGKLAVFPIAAGVGFFGAVIALAVLLGALSGIGLVPFETAESVGAFSDVAGYAGATIAVLWVIAR